MISPSSLWARARAVFVSYGRSDKCVVHEQQPLIFIPDGKWDELSHLPQEIIGLCLERLLPSWEDKALHTVKVEVWGKSWCSSRAIYKRHTAKQVPERRELHFSISFPPFCVVLPLSSSSQAEWAGNPGGSPEKRQFPDYGRYLCRGIVPPRGVWFIA